jgi:NitT/TauT family transport system ATP-binding protein
MSEAYELKDTILKVQGVNKTLGGKSILKNVDLEIKDIVRPGCSQGQVVSLLGPSGIGKTTLFRILAGLDHPDSGSVLLGPEQLPVHRGMVGVVAQHYPLFPNRTVLSNLVVAGRMAGLTHNAATEKARSLLTQFLVEESEDKYPSQLSGGMRQRVAIAQQFMCSEHYILMDEPFSGLDPIAVDHVIAFIQQIASAHELNTIIIVTHDIEAAVQVSDTLWLLGRDHNAEGQPLPGARVQATYNLIERGLAWQPHVFDKPEFHQMTRDIRNIFPAL